MNILFVGAGGSGMGALIKWHSQLGNDVYLQDDATPSKELLEKYPQGKIFDPATSPSLDYAVISDAIAASHPLRALASKRAIPVRSYAEELGALTNGHELIAIAGTHGKSTTTALVSWGLAAAERDPLCLIGAEIKAWHGGFRFGAGPVVAEADEFKKHFLHLNPTIILVTSLEADHFDTYATEDELVATFVEFCSKPSVQSIFIARGTLALDQLSEALGKLGRSPIRFGSDDDLVHAKNVTISSDGQTHITVAVNEKTIDLKLQCVTCPHVSNLLGAIAILTHVGVPLELLGHGIGSFPGILRRLELLGNVGNNPLYSDYAHHPTAVRETLRILRKIFPRAAIGIIFEPHERLRTSTLRDAYQTAFVDADAIALLPVYDPIGRERPDILDAATVISPFDSNDVTQLANYDAAFAWTKAFAKKNAAGGIIVIMGAGPIDGAFRKFIARKFEN